MRQQTAVLFADQSKEGPYGELIRWAPGAFSRPHLHDQTRGIFVVSRTWWVNSGNAYDERSTYPFHAGTFSTDVANAVHWDGARSGEKEPAIILLTGMDPVKRSRSMRTESRGRRRRQPTKERKAHWARQGVRRWMSWLRGCDIGRRAT